MRHVTSASRVHVETPDVPNLDTSHRPHETCPSQRLLHVMHKRPFETVVAEHGPTVLRVCLAVLGAGEADDAWSEAFLAAMKAYPALPADANVEAWLVTIAHRKAIDVTRAAARRAVPVGEILGGSTDAARRASADGVAALRRTYPAATKLGTSQPRTLELGTGESR